MKQSTLQKFNGDNIMTNEKLYLIPTTPSYEYEPYDHIYLVAASSDRDAYNKAKSELDANIPQELPEYESYNIETYNLPTFPFHESKKYDILNSIFLSMKGFEHMSYFNVNWNDYTNELSELAAKEQWSSDTYPDRKILTNYMVHTYRKLSSEKNIIINKDYALFNTGLFTEFYQPIYAYNDKSGLQFLTAYELGNMNISERPPRADYFEDTSLLLFDWHYEININYKHILKDINNLDRIPEKLKDSKNILNNLNGSIETMKKKVSANYKLAIPQYYEGKIQLLLPLCLEDDETPSLALTVTKVGSYYQGHTCLTLDMAYNNARLIAKPESNWLKP